MARRNSTTENPSNDEATTPESTDATTTEAPAEVTEAPIDLGPFQTAVQTAVAGKDESTGEVSVEAIAEVNVAYRALDGIKPKNAAKNWVEEQIKAAIMPPALDAVTARAFSMVKDNLTAGSKSGGEKAPADPTTGYVNKLAAHRLALSLIEVPEGVEGDKASLQADELVASLSEAVTSYRAWLTNEAEDKGDAPEVSPVVRTAFKLAAGKASGGGRSSGGSGVRRDIGKHIQSAFTGVESGTFLTIAEIANHTSEEYGSDKPSQGAVSARLFPSSGKSTVEGVVPVAAGEAGEGKPRGAKKV
jgi:hypothetical protein